MSHKWKSPPLLVIISTYFIRTPLSFLSINKTISNYSKWRIYKDEYVLSRKPKVDGKSLLRTGTEYKTDF